jgi:hypothetical protein
LAKQQRNASKVSRIPIGKNIWNTTPNPPSASNKFRLVTILSENRKNVFKTLQKCAVKRAKVLFNQVMSFNFAHL